MFNNTDYTPTPRGRTGFYHSRGPWRQLVAANALCPDGRVRKVRLRQTANTMFSVTGRTRILGVNISGVVMMAPETLWVPENDPRAKDKLYNSAIAGEVPISHPDAGEYIFYPDTTSKHYARLAERLPK